MISQKEIFKSGEGDCWFRRNKRNLKQLKNDKDIILKIIKSIELFPKKVLEIGCSDGVRLEIIRKTYKAECYGIDPSSEAIAEGKKRFQKISLMVGTADDLPFDANFFDLIIFGFCLYLCDRNDLFKIAYEADRCLINKSFLIIQDFFPSFAYKNHYAHRDGVYSYKMDYSRMFTWNPVYTEISKTIYSHTGYALRDIPDEKLAIIILRKHEQFAYPEKPFGCNAFSNLRTS